MVTKQGIALLCLGLLMVAFIPGRALAVLGGTADSVEADRKAFSAVRGSSTIRNAYTVQELNYGGTTIREYVSPGGIVFAIAWDGVRTPDLATLLGSYADQYNEALGKTPYQPGARHLSINANDVVVERWGQMRNLQGRAYAPALIPTGVTVDEIK